MTYGYLKFKNPVFNPGINVTVLIHGNNILADIFAVLDASEKYLGTGKFLFEVTANIVEPPPSFLGTSRGRI